MDFSHFPKTLPWSLRRVIPSRQSFLTACEIVLFAHSHSAISRRTPLISEGMHIVIFIISGGGLRCSFMAFGKKEAESGARIAFFWAKRNRGG